MAAQGAAHHLRLMDDLGLLQHVLPDVHALKGVAQPDPQPVEDVDGEVDTGADGDAGKHRSADTQRNRAKPHDGVDGQYGCSHRQ